MSWQAVYYHFRKWSADGSLQKVWQASIQTVQADLDLSQLNLDGSHTLAKKGGESVAYQGRKRAKTSNILPIIDANGYIVACTGVIAGHHHDAFDLKTHLQAAFRSVKRLGLTIAGAFFNAGSAFDTPQARQVCFSYGVIPNIAENRCTAKLPSVGANACSTARCTSVALPISAVLPGWISSAPCSSALTVRTPISWVLTILCLL
ncbi:MAG: transposase [Aggregatilineaceae bacterium]